MTLFKFYCEKPPFSLCDFQHYTIEKVKIAAKNSQFVFDNYSLKFKDLQATIDGEYDEHIRKNLRNQYNNFYKELADNFRKSEKNNMLVHKILIEYSLVTNTENGAALNFAFEKQKNGYEIEYHHKFDKDRFIYVEYIIHLNRKN